MDIDTSPLKRCSSAPIIPNAAARTNGTASQSSQRESDNTAGASSSALHPLRSEDPAMSPHKAAGSMNCETTPAPNIFSRTRRYSSGSFSTLAAVIGTSAACSSAGSPSSSSSNHQNQLHLGSPSPATGSGSGSVSGPRLTPRVSQLRKEECADISNTREVSHERGLHNQLQISQSWEDLTIVTENWSCRDDLAANSLLNCSSPSPTSSRHHQLAAAAAQQQQQQPPPPHAAYGAIRYPFGMSPSPTRKTFATRRSMSPNHVRPSQLCPVKRKFDMDDGGGSPPPHKKMFLDVVARGTSPIHSLPFCSSPDSGTYEGRTTPKLFISKLCSSNSLSSFSSASASPTSQLEGMNEGVSGSGSAGSVSGGGGTDIKGVINTNSNSSATASETGGGGGRDEEAKEVEDGERDSKVDEVEDDHPMVDVSRESSVVEEGNCDTESGGGGRIEATAKDKVDIIMAGERAESEVDDGIGDEETGPTEEKRQPSEVTAYVPVL